MTSSDRPASGAGSTVLHDAQRVVDTLLAHAIITPDQAPAAVEALTASAATVPASPARGRAAEVAGYSGGALVASAAALFLVTTWSSVSTPGRAGLLAGVALILAVAGAVLVSGLRRAACRSEISPRRRLVSTLWSGAAWCAGGAAYVLADRPAADGGVTPAWLVGGAVALVAAGAAYAVVPALVGQAAAWAALWWTVQGGAELLDVEYTDVYAAVFVVLGATWAVLGVRGVLRERNGALVLGTVMALLGAQSPLLDGTPVVAHVLTGAVAVACFAAYLRLHAWPLLAGGVAATTLVVPEAVRDATDDALPVTGVLLVAGLTLLAACALGLRLHGEHRK